MIGGLWISLAAAQGAGRLQIHVAQIEDRRAHRAYEGRVRREQRRWQRASRRSDDPVPRPEIPDPPGVPIPGATVAISGEALTGGVMERTTDDAGQLSVSVPAGHYRIEVYVPRVRVEGHVDVAPDRTVLVPVLVDGHATDVLYPSPGGGSP